MSKDLEVSYLLDFYGDMLTKKQKDSIEYYYNADLSLSEIAYNLGITRQGVRDAIKRSETLLFDMENRLGLAKKFRSMQNDFETILDLTKKISDANIKFARSRDIQDAVMNIENVVQNLRSE